MDAIRHWVGTLLLSILFFSTGASGQKFYPDDPIHAVPPPLPVGAVRERDINQLYDFLKQSRNPERRADVPASGINTLGEVPDSSWFTNRHGRKRMSRQELQEGPAKGMAPVPPFTVVGGKAEGASLGFEMEDAEGRLFFVKLDPLHYPELASAADAIVTRFLHAIGYNTPANYIVYARPEDFTLSPDAEISTFRYGPEEPMTWGAFMDIINTVRRRPDGTFRMMASLAVEGKPIGPFRFEGVRRDDPNDTVPHENRRDLRGLHVFAAWLNHTDSKAGNTLDTVVEENGTRYVRHYLLDFGAALGSDSVLPKDPRFGYDFILPEPGKVWRRMLSFGFYKEPWEKAAFPNDPAIGNFESRSFDPENWKSNFPNPAFLSRTPEDEFWAAKIVMAFTDDDIRAIVETGEYSNPESTEYVTKALIERRDTIGKVYFSKVLPLDQFAVRNGRLQFEDLGVKYGFHQPSSYRVQWFRFDNETDTRSPLAGDGSAMLPGSALQTETGSYIEALIQRAAATPALRVTLRKTAEGFDVVGIEHILQ